jgi:hypothetical protein
MKHKKFNEIYPYTYYIKRKKDGLQYHGVRISNVKSNRTPVEDFGVYYFTSGKLKKEFKNNPSEFIWKLCFTFDTPLEAIIHEEHINNIIFKLPTWANAYGKYVPVDAAKVSREKSLMMKYGVNHNFKIPSVANKRKETIKNKFGVENPSQSEEIKRKKKETLLRRYGTSSTFKVIDVKSAMMLKYGADNPQRCPEIHNKTLKTNIKKYGVKYTFQSPNVIEKIHKKRKEMYIRLAKMSDNEFESYLKTISPIKSIQSQKKSQRQKGMDLLAIHL